MANVIVETLVGMDPPDLGWRPTGVVYEVSNTDRHVFGVDMLVEYIKEPKDICYSPKLNKVMLTCLPDYEYFFGNKENYFCIGQL